VVRLRGGSQFELASIVVERSGLRAGVFLSVEDRERLLREDEPYRARSRALRLLESRDRARREVETRLRQQGFESEVITDTSAWLEHLGYLNDERFAQHYTAEKVRAGWGPRRIEAELRQKGIDRSTIKQVLEGGEDKAQAAIEGYETLMALVRRRFGAQFASDADTAERRLTGYLARRGYDWETISRISREMRSEAGGEAIVP
jgi:regulatory protein